MGLAALIKHPFIKTLVYANVFIAVCALAQVLLTHLLFHIPFDFKNVSYLVLILLSTFIQYNLQRGYMVTRENVYTDRSQWLIKNKKKMLITNAAALLVVLPLCWELSWTSIWIMVGAEVLSTLYFLQPFNLRRYGYIKPFLISLVWAVSCVLVPLIENNLITTEITGAWFFLLAQFLFIAELCLVFDIKDAAQDKRSGVHTYANRFGETTAKIISLFLLVGAGVSFYCQFAHASASGGCIIALAVLLLTAIATLFSKDLKHDFWFYLVIDGLMIVELLVALPAIY